jgi:hypothetical protein
VLTDVGEDNPLKFADMPVPPMNEVTRVLSAIDGGDPHAAEQLLPLVYEELRKLAAQKLAQEKPGQTLEATAAGVAVTQLRFFSPGLIPIGPFRRIVEWTRFWGIATVSMTYQTREQLFHAAAEMKDPAQRAAFLDAACGQHPRLRAEFEELLQHDDAVGSFLNEPVV